MPWGRLADLLFADDLRVSLQTGNGQFGGIGNGTWAHAPSPVKVKTISGLSEYNDTSGRVEPIRIREISVGNAHIAIVLVSSSTRSCGLFLGPELTLRCPNRTMQSSKLVGSNSAEMYSCGVTTCITSLARASGRTFRRRNICRLSLMRV